MVWIKARNAAASNNLFDTSRPNTGGFEYFYTDTYGASVDSGTTRVTTMDSDGFSLGTNGNVNEVSGGETYVAWGWKAGGVPSANNKRRTDGSTTETTLAAGGASPNADQWTTTNGLQYMKQSVNTAGGFSLSEYESNASVPNDTHTIKIPHGLGATPNLVIIYM